VTTLWRLRVTTLWRLRVTTLWRLRVTTLWRLRETTLYLRPQMSVELLAARDGPDAEVRDALRRGCRGTRCEVGGTRGRRYEVGGTRGRRYEVGGAEVGGARRIETRPIGVRDPRPMETGQVLRCCTDTRQVSRCCTQLRAAAPCSSSVQQLRAAALSTARSSLPRGDLSIAPLCSPSLPLYARGLSAPRSV
jgi:hypothetical protein